MVRSEKDGETTEQDTHRFGALTVTEGFCCLRALLDVVEFGKSDKAGRKLGFILKLGNALHIGLLEANYKWLSNGREATRDLLGHLLREIPICIGLALDGIDEGISSSESFKGNSIEKEPTLNYRSCTKEIFADIIFYAIGRFLSLALLLQAGDANKFLEDEFVKASNLSNSNNINELLMINTQMVIDSLKRFLVPMRQTIAELKEHIKLNRLAIFRPLTNTEEHCLKCILYPQIKRAIRLTLRHFHVALSKGNCVENTLLWEKKCEKFCKNTLYKKELLKFLPIRIAKIF